MPSLRLLFSLIYSRFCTRSRRSIDGCLLRFVNRNGYCFVLSENRKRILTLYLASKVGIGTTRYLLPTSTRDNTWHVEGRRGGDAERKNSKSNRNGSQYHSSPLGRSLIIASVPSFRSSRPRPNCFGFVLVHVANYLIHDVAPCTHFPIHLVYD